MALRKGESVIRQEMFRDAVDKVLMGEKTGRRPTDEELERVAVHEIGHAIVTELLRPGAVSHITIAPRGRALGFVRQIPEDDQYLYTKDQLEQQIDIALAGCLAEELQYGNRSTGAQNDFQQASQLARTMVRCGLSRLGIVDEEHLPERLLEREVRFILAERERATRDLLRPYQGEIARLAKQVVREESVDGAEFRQWLNGLAPAELTSAMTTASE